jgi:AcrR family transcriptional regulator
MPFESSEGKILSPRAQAMRQKLMLAGAELLGEVGIERISTNLVAMQAGVTPPVFYRHFRDKYDLLAALGDDLMQRQYEVLYDWLDRAAPAGFQHLMSTHYDFMLATIRATAELPGAVWIMRALRAVPSLSDLRIASHAAVADRIANAMMPLLPDADPVEIRLRARISVEAEYAAVEMALEDPTMPAESICAAVTAIWEGGLIMGVPRKSDTPRPYEPRDNEPKLQ